METKKIDEKMVKKKSGRDGEETKKKKRKSKREGRAVYQGDA